MVPAHEDGVGDEIEKKGEQQMIPLLEKFIN